MSKVDMTMPQMGESIAEGTIIKWFKKEGDKIEQDENLLEISTDKVDSEIPSPHAGTVKKIFKEEGETVEVGDKIAEIETNGDETERSREEKKEGKKEQEKKKAKKEDESETGEKTKAEDQSKVVEDEDKKKETESKKEDAVEKTDDESVEEDTKEATETAEAKSEDSETKEVSDEEEQSRAYSPLVRSIAREENISDEELENIEGSGANGRVTKKDIIAHIKNRPRTKEESAEPEDADTVAEEAQPDDDRTEVIPMGTMRKSIAEHMVRSVKTSPHVFAVSEADMTEIVRFRTANKDRFLEKTGAKLTYMPFILQACSRALLDFPLVNSSLDGDKIIRKKYVNIGVAVALENNGLIVPVIRNTTDLNVIGLAKAVSDLAARARSKKLKPEEVQDGTFSITNMGSFGSIMGLPIINQPQVAILGVGVTQKRPVVIDDAIAIRDMMYISLSFDHRIVDGALAGQFLDRIATYLTNFDTGNIL